MSRILILLLAVLSAGCFRSAQRADADFRPAVAHPAYASQQPLVLIDQAHRNFHTASGRYSPFAKLLRADGYRVEAGADPFDRADLSKVSVMVISNAKGKPPRKDHPALTEEEADRLVAWIKTGGSLLLVADHYPMGSAVAPLARRLGVQMSNGWTEDPAHQDPAANDKSRLVFSSANGLLGNHPILRGRSDQERIQRVVTFTGQSLKGPEGSVALLPLASTAGDWVPVKIEEIPRYLGLDTDIRTTFDGPVSAEGRSQGVAFRLGRGRVVVLGEAAMLTAQVDEQQRFGFNVPGNDNVQFALNVMHWLSGAIE